MKDGNAGRMERFPPIQASPFRSPILAQDARGLCLWNLAKAPFERTVGLTCPQTTKPVTLHPVPTPTLSPLNSKPSTLKSYKA